MPKILEAYAKIIETKYGPVVVSQDIDEQDAPILKMSFKPKRLGVCYVSLIFEANSEGFIRREDQFSTITLEQVENSVGSMLTNLLNFGE